MKIWPGSFTAARRRDGEQAFPLLAKVLHWSTAALVLAMFCAGVLMTELGSGAWAAALVTFHEAAGVLLLALAVVRNVYRALARLRGRWPANAGSPVVRGVLNVLLVAIPLLGLAGASDLGAREVYGGILLPEIWPQGAGYAGELLLSHTILAFTLMGLVAVHICLALDDYIRQPVQAEAASGRAAAEKPPSILPPDMP
jgi:cytochrome b561